MKTKILSALFLSFLILIISACTKSEPRIDTTSDESMKSSIEKVRIALPQEKKAEFDEALKILAFSSIDLKSIFTQGEAGVANTQAKMKESLNGKTGIEVITAAEAEKKKRQEEEKKQALQEIKELEEKKVAAEKDKKELGKFKILRSRFYKRKQEFMGAQPIIELTVKNETSSAISRAHFDGILASPKRSVPWLKESFNYSISGGLESGEKTTWKLSPNMFSKWGTVDAPKAAILTVEVVRLDGPENKELFSSMNFSEQDEERLMKLKEQYGI